MEPCGGRARRRRRWRRRRSRNSGAACSPTSSDWAATESRSSGGGFQDQGHYQSGAKFSWKLIECGSCAYGKGWWHAAVFYPFGHLMSWGCMSGRICPGKISWGDCPGDICPMGGIVRGDLSYNCPKGKRTAALWATTPETAIR
jgi:hypothetical protein